MNIHLKLETIPFISYIVSSSNILRSFGVEGRGTFYETAGCLRDVIQNHLFQIVALLAMEPQAYRGYGAVHSEKTKVFQAMLPLKPDDLVRGQYTGYRKELCVAKRSDVETFCALGRFFVGQKLTTDVIIGLHANQSHPDSLQRFKTL